MQPPTHPPNHHQAGPNRSLGAELAVSVLTCLGLLGGTFAAFGVAQIAPGPSLVVGALVLVVGLVTAIAIPCGVSRMGRLLVGLLERPPRNAPRADEPATDSPNPDRPERLDRSQFDGLDHGQFGGPER